MATKLLPSAEFLLSFAIKAICHADFFSYFCHIKQNQSAYLQRQNI